ncbi:MAG: hypothetical protein JSR89_04995 [Proteobacteria bacterium]|nr:hypothetical protein [Pseudomonadota bacterium]
MSSPDRIADIFDDTRIAALAETARLPKDANVQAFANEMRRAVHLYLADAKRPSVNTLRREIEALYKAARQRRYERAAELFRDLSSTAREFLSAANPKLTMPVVGDFRDGAKREKACEQTEQLCSFGAQWGEGRRRPTGRRSSTWRPILSAPPASAQFAKRDAERDFVVNIRLAYLEACGAPPPPTARLVRKGPKAHMISGPFARMVDECLQLVDAPHARAVGIINDLDRRRRSLEK